MSIHPKSILVPTDFSETADQAMAFAQRLALDFGAELHLVHVSVLLEGRDQDEALKEELTDLKERLEKDSRERVANLPPGFQVHGHLVRGLAVGESLLEVAAEFDAGLLVIGTNGRRGLRHLLLGSVAEELLRTAAIPVLSVRKGANIDERSAGRILLPHDFSASSTEALRHAKEWARVLGAGITLLHVVEPVVYPEFYAVNAMPGELYEKIAMKSRKALEEIAAENLEGIDTRIEVIHDRAVEAILEMANPKEYDLIIMGNRGLSGLEHLLLGSVVEGVIRRSEIPVLSVRGAEENDRD